MRCFNDGKEEQEQDLVELLRLAFCKQDQFQDAADSLARLEKEIAEYQSRIEDAILNYMGLQYLSTLVIRSPHLPVGEVWLCQVDTAGTLEMTRVRQVQACAIKETPF